MAASKTIAEEWESLAAALGADLPGGQLHPVQKKEMEKSFFSGAMVMFYKLVGEAPDDEAAGTAFMKGIEDQLRSYFINLAHEPRQPNIWTPSNDNSH